MDDTELELVAQLSFVRSDLEQFVLSVLGSVDQQFNTVEWPANEAELGRQLAMLGKSLQWHAIVREAKAQADGSPPS